MRFFLRFFFALLFAYPAMSIGAGTDTLLTALKTEIGRKKYTMIKSRIGYPLKKLQQRTPTGLIIQSSMICV
jgi:hypothetical protein